MTDRAPLTGVPFYILVSLSSGPRHGYALMQDIKKFAGVRVGPGTLYKAVSRLEALGLIEALTADDRRLPYGITESGSREVVRSRMFLDAIVREADRRARDPGEVRAADAP